MEAKRVIKTIKSNVLHELDKYIGKKVEIIIIAEQERKNYQTNKKPIVKEFYGSCPTIEDGLEIQNRLRSEWDD